MAQIDDRFVARLAQMLQRTLDHHRFEDARHVSDTYRKTVAVALQPVPDPLLTTAPGRLTPIPASKPTDPTMFCKQADYTRRTQTGITPRARRSATSTPHRIGGSGATLGPEESTHQQRHRRDH